MFSTEIIVASIIIVVLIFLLDRAGSYLQKVSPAALKYIDYSTFTIAGISGLIIYLGKGGPLVRYVFLISIIMYFIILRHTVHKGSSPQA